MATLEQDLPAAAQYRSPFAKLDLRALTQKVTENKNQAAFESNEKFTNGDHFQGGDGWVGPPDKASPLFKLAIAKV